MRGPLLLPQGVAEPHDQILEDAVAPVEILRGRHPFPVILAILQVGAVGGVLVKADLGAGGFLFASSIDSFPISTAPKTPP